MARLNFFCPTGGGKAAVTRNKHGMRYIFCREHGSFVIAGNMYRPTKPKQGRCNVDHDFKPYVRPSVETGCAVRVPQEKIEETMDRVDESHVNVFVYFDKDGKLCTARTEHWKRPGCHLVGLFNGTCSWKDFLAAVRETEREMANAKA